MPGTQLATVLLGLAALGGVSLVAGLVHQNFQNSIRAAAASREQMTHFDERQSRFQAEEWAKLPPNPELWLLPSFANAIDKDLRQQCLDRIAALPDLERQMRGKLAGGFGQHALGYLMDHYLGTASSQQPECGQLERHPPPPLRGR
ncbi:MAG: hypothetical protein U0R19_03995 [Bryobacteraceae bacterium]